MEGNGWQGILIDQNSTRFYFQSLNLIHVTAALFNFSLDWLLHSFVEQKSGRRCVFIKCFSVICGHSDHG